MAQTAARALAKVLDSDLPQPVAALSPCARRVWRALAEGQSYREAAESTGLTRGAIWRIVRLHPSAFALVDTRLLPLADESRDTLAVALARGLAPEADDRAQERGLKAAVTVERSLAWPGIAAAKARAAAERASARVDVTVTIDVPGLLRAPSPPALDVPVPLALSAPAGARELVAETQPRRSRSSSRRAIKQR